MKRQISSTTFFCNVTQHIKILDTVNPINKYSMQYQEHSMFLFTVTREEIHEIIISLKNKNTIGKDDQLSNKMLKIIAQDISHILSVVINI